MLSVPGRIVLAPCPAADHARAATLPLATGRCGRPCPAPRAAVAVAWHVPPHCRAIRR